MNRYAWRASIATVSLAALAMTGWSLFVVAHDTYGVPELFAYGAVAVYDGAAIACMYLASEAVRDGRAAIGAVLGTLLMAGVSVYLNTTHARLLDSTMPTVPAAVLFSSPTMALLLPSGLAWSAARYRARVARGDAPFRLPAFGGWVWLLAPKTAGSKVRERALAHIEHAGPSAAAPKPKDRTAASVLRERFAAMDPAEVIRIAHEAQPELLPAELASLLVGYGVIVDATQVALVLQRQPAAVTRQDQASLWAARAARMEQGRAARDQRKKERREAREKSLTGLTRIEFSAVPEGRHTPVVYFLRNGDRVKIGTSTNLKKRVASLSLRRQDLLLVVEGDRETEQAFHQQFAKHRVGSTEWFHLTGGLTQWVRAARKELPAVPWTIPDDQGCGAEVTIERADDATRDVQADSPELVMPQVAAITARPFRWEDIDTADATTKVTAASPAEQPRQLVTATVTITPSELRRQARKLNRQAVRSTNRPVTIKTLQDELGLSRREATELRREVTGGERS